MYRLLLFICLLWTLATAGCTSIRSVLLYRDQTNQNWQKTRHLPGVPITLKIPTHLRVQVKEMHYLTKVQAGGVSKWERVQMDVPVRGVDHEFLYTDKIFTVDFKRPAAGEMNMTLKFNDEQYFEQIQHKVVDETIEDVGKLIESIGKSGLLAASASGPADPTLQTLESVVAVEIFDIDEPDFEMRLTAFLNCHLNNSHDAWVAPPGVANVRRIPLDNGHAGPVQLCPTGNCISEVYELPAVQIVQ